MATPASLRILRSKQRFTALTLTQQTEHGRPTGYVWEPVEAATDKPCRLDLAFMRPGKDTPVQAEAGIVPNRMGVLFLLPGMEAVIEAEMRIVMISGPVTGTYQISALPEVCVGASSVSHIEVGVTEVAQALAGQAPLVAGP